MRPIYSRVLITLVCLIVGSGLIPASFPRPKTASASPRPIIAPPPPRPSLPRVTRFDTDIPPVLSPIRDEEPPATPAATVQAPVFLPGNGPVMYGRRVIQTERLDMYVGRKTFTAEQVAAIAPRIEQLLRGAEERFGSTLAIRVSLAFYHPVRAPSRGTRGIAYTGESRAEVFYRANESIDRAAIIATHELSHVLEAQRYGEEAQRRADYIMLEGMATWISSEPWLAMYGAPNWKTRARQLRDSGVPLRLMGKQRYGSDAAYELWASFVDFLIERYGREKVDALYVSGRGRATGSSDYEGVLGKSIGQLADEWRGWVSSD